MEQIVVLGKTYKDEVSGFEGVATSRCEYLKGNTRIELTAKAVEGKRPAAKMGFYYAILTVGITVHGETLTII